MQTIADVAVIRSSRWSVPQRRFDHRICPWHGAERPGAALVEFAVVLPAVLALFALLIELSRVLLLQHTIDTAAYEGARTGVIAGATIDDVIQETEHLLEASNIVQATIQVTPEEIDEDTAFVAVEVSVPIKPNQWFLMPDMIDFNLRSSVALVTERPPVTRLTGLPRLLGKVNGLLRGNDDEQSPRREQANQN